MTSFGKGNGNYFGDTNGQFFVPFLSAQINRGRCEKVFVYFVYGAAFKTLCLRHLGWGTSGPWKFRREANGLKRHLGLLFWTSAPDGDRAEPNLSLTLVVPSKSGKPNLGVF